MTHLLAIILMALAAVFLGFHLAHGVWTWQFFAVCSLLCALISSHEKWPF